MVLTAGRQEVNSLDNSLVVHELEFVLCTVVYNGLGNQIDYKAGSFLSCFSWIQA